MSTMTPGDYRNGVLRTMQIIHFALVTGVLLFLAIVFLVVRKGALDKEPWSLEGTRTLVSMGFGAVAIVLSFMLPGVVLGAARKSAATGRWGDPNIPVPTDPAERETLGLLMGIQTALIVRLALLEGAAFFAIIAFMTEGKALALVVAGVLLVLMLLYFPSGSSVEQQLENERVALRE